MSENNANHNSLPAEYVNQVNNSQGQQSAVDTQKLESAATYTKVIYALYLASLLLGITLFVGVVIAYVKRDDMTGTIYRSHIDSLIKIFWMSLIWTIIGSLTTFFFIGFVILFALATWFLVKTITGLIKCIDGKPLNP